MAEDLYAMSRLAKAAQQKETRADGYKGKVKFVVYHGNYAPVLVYEPTAAAAIWTAGKHWGVDPRKTEFHQGCRVRACR